MTDDCVPMSELEELVEEWQGRAEGNTPIEYTHKPSWQIAADALQALINKHDPKQ